MGGYDVVLPQTEAEKQHARRNAQLIAFTHWGDSLAPAALRRVRRLVDAHEVAGAFRFPIATADFGNVGTLISFRVGHVDAEMLVPHFAPVFDPFDLTNPPNWYACFKTTVNGQVVTPFTLHTVLLPDTLSPQIAENVRTHSRSRYGRERVQVEAEIRRSVNSEETDEVLLFDDLER